MFAIPAERPGEAEMANILDQRIMLRRVLRKLPDHYQEVLLFRFAEGKKFSEIASERGQSLEATKSLFRRAIAALHSEM